jgi:conjugative transfer signal peptidase TraF
MRRRWPILASASAAALAALAVLALPAAEDRLLYNRTPSVPIGFYLRTDEPLERGAFVTVRAVDVAPAAAAARRFNGPRDRFIKRVAALAGDHVCALDDRVTISGGVDVERRAVDRAGQPLTAWEGCRVLEADEVLLLGDTADSFDGRYWGPVDRDLIEGVWRPFNVERARGD